MSALLDRAGIAALIPHAGEMCLWDALLAADASSVRVKTCRHRDPRHPLRMAGRLGAVHLIEYGAQAMAVHGGWLARQSAGSEGAKPGVLAAVREVQLLVDRIDDLPGDLEGEARRLVSNAGGWMYEFRLHSGGRDLATGRASVIHGS